MSSRTGAVETTSLRGRLLRQWRWVVPVVLIVAGNCCLCLWPQAASVRYRVLGLSTEAAVIVAGVAMLLVGTGWASVNGFHADALRRQRDAAVARAAQLESHMDAAARATDIAMDEQLVQMFDDLGLGASERVSLYAVDRDRHRFIRSGRYSPNPELRSGGQIELPTDQGVIGQALKQGTYRATLLFDSEPERHQQHARTGLVSRSRVVELRMRSVEYAAFALPDPADNSYGAVIVWESERRKGLPSFALLRQAVTAKQPSLMRSLAAARSAASSRPQPGPAHD